MTTDISLGTYTWEQDTKNGIHRFTRDENGRKQTQYITPASFNGDPRPDEVEIIVRYTGPSKPASKPAARPRPAAKKAPAKRAPAAKK